jgi:hypothetical protein
MNYGGPKGINWELALEFYLTPNEEGKIPSYQDVADKFGVSKKEVGLRAKRENWLQRRQNVYDLSGDQYVEKRIELVEETTKQHIEMWREARRIICERLKLLDEEMGKPDSTRELLSLIKALKIAIEGERTSLGLPNSIPYSKQPEVEGPFTLPPELIQEIDSLFMKNNPTVNFC